MPSVRSFLATTMKLPAIGSSALLPARRVSTARRAVGAVSARPSRRKGRKLYPRTRQTVKPCVANSWQASATDIIAGLVALVVRSRRYLPRKLAGFRWKFATTAPAGRSERLIHVSAWLWRSGSALRKNRKAVMRSNGPGAKPWSVVTSPWMSTARGHREPASSSISGEISMPVADGKRALRNSRIRPVPHAKSAHEQRWPTTSGRTPASRRCSTSHSRPLAAFRSQRSSS